eukprot:gene14773-10567_t
MATQAAVLAGFTTTCLIELNIPPDTHYLAKSCLHIAAIFSICSNIACVSLSTITNIWGSGKALRGKDGSMDEAVEGINSERELIFRTFAFGLCGNLCTVLCACFITMSWPINFFAATMVVYTLYLIYTNAIRIQRKFHMADVVRLDDLTAFPTNGNSNGNGRGHGHGISTASTNTDVDSHSSSALLGHRGRSSKGLLDV